MGKPAQRIFQRFGALPIMAVLILVAALPLTVMIVQQQARLSQHAAMADATGSDWPMYLHDVERTSNNTTETILSPANASQITKLWQFKTNGIITAGAAVVNNIVYIGGGDGYEYALDAVTGAMKWKTYLGQIEGTYGVTSTATVMNNTVYVGGGDAKFYALDATTGAVLWNIPLGNPDPKAGWYLWDSPLVYNGYIYFGTASLADNPLIQGELFKIDPNSHQIVGTTKFVPDGQIGGGIWTSPSVDAATNTIYVTTGTEGSEPPTTQPLAIAIVSIDANTMAVKDHWQVPNPVNDSDWGNSPLLYTTKTGLRLVSAVNKNGFAYSFRAASLSAGPIGAGSIAFGGAAPWAGDGNSASSAFGNGTIFMGAGDTVINNTFYNGSVRAIDGTTGKPLWTLGTGGTVLPALAYANGLLIDGAGSSIEVRDASSGKILYSYLTGDQLYGPPAISNGRIFIGSNDGYIYAFGLPATPVSPTPSPMASNGTGLMGYYFNSSNFTGSPSARLDGFINYYWDLEPPQGTRINRLGYSVYWTGFIVPQYSETYTFSIKAAGGVQLKINNQVVIKQTTTTRSTFTGSIPLTAGQRYPINLAYVNLASRGASMQFSWSSPSTPPQIVPQSQLFPQ